MMNRENFITFLKHPEKIDQGNLEVFKDLSLRYPYCSSIQVLLAYGLFVENDLDFNHQLKRAAACVSSRKKLKQLFLEKVRIHPDKPNSLQPAKKEPVLQEHPEEPIRNSGIVQEILDETSAKELAATESKFHDGGKDEIKKSRQELLELVHRRLAEIESAKRNNSIVTSIHKEVEGPLQAEESTILPEGSLINEVQQEQPPKRILSKTEILEKFIREEPRITSPKTAFYRPSEIAAHSSTDEEEIVSETLAKLYADQGNIAKARKIYERLSLLFPEKSLYFADQILKIIGK